jgi:hypothetical protein
MSAFRGGGGGWTGFSAYMRDKTIKLAGQFDDRFEKKTDIFAGLTFWSTGRIEGVDFDIKETITVNGGEYQQYGFRHVSHIIASNLALSNQNWKKLLGGKFTSKTYHVVTPQWIVDSISAGKVLPEIDYIPECIRVRGGIKEFFDTSKTDRNYDDSEGLMITDDFTMSPDPTRELRTVRIRITDPSLGTSLVDELFYEIVSRSEIDASSFVRKAHLSIFTRDGSMNIVNVPFATCKTSLSEALVDVLSNQNMRDALKVILTLYVRNDSDDRSSTLELFPSSTETPPTVLASRLSNMSKLLMSSCEDDIDIRLKEVFANAGPSVASIILDCFNNLSRLRQSDVAREILLSLRKHVKNHPNDDLRIWYAEVEEKARECFRWYNGGAELVL